MGEIGGWDPALSTLFTRVGIGGVCVPAGCESNIGCLRGKRFEESKKNNKYLNVYTEK